MGGAVLINKATKQPEWVSSEKLEGALSAGTHFSKTGTVNVTAPEGGRYSTRVQDLADRERNMGMTKVSEAELASEQHEARKRASYDNGFDKFLAFTEGVASSVTFGAADIAMDDEATRYRADVNSGYRGMGEVVGIVGPALAAPPTLLVRGAAAAGKAGASSLVKGAVKSVLRNTPAGWAARLSTKAGLKVGGKFAAGTAKAKVTAAAVEGMVEGAIWSTGQTLSDAVVHDKELSAEAVLSSMAEGAAFGGAVSGGFAAAGAGIKAIRGKLADRNMRKSNPLFDLDSDISKQFRGAVVGSADDAIKYGKYFDEKLAAFDALELRGVKGDYGLRREAYAGYKQSVAKYKKFLGFDPKLPIPAEKAEAALRRFLEKSSKNDMLKFVKVLDEMHVRTSELDDLMKPPSNLVDEVKLKQREVTPDPDMFAPPATGPVTPLSDEAAIKGWKQMAGEAPLTGSGMSTPPTPYKDMNTRIANFVRNVDQGNMPAFITERMKREAALLKIDVGPDMTPAMLAEEFKKVHAKMGPAPKKWEHLEAFDAEELKKGYDPSSAKYKNKVADIQNQLLNDHANKASQKLPGYTAKRYDERLIEAGKLLKGEDGARFNALDTLAVAEALGVDMDKVPVVGPVADSVLKLWLFYRLGGLMSGAATKAVAGKGKSGAMRRALYNGFARKGAEFGRAKGGAFGAGFAYQAAYSGSKAAFEGVSTVSSKTGEMADKIKNVVDKVLTPGIKRGIKRSVAPYILSNATYATPVDSDPKDDYGRIEAQLSRSATNEQAMQSYLNTQYDDFRMLDAPLADAMIKTKQAQLVYLYKKLPQPPVTLPMGTKWAPPPSSMVAFKETAATYANPDYVLSRIEEGIASKQNIDDLAVLWPTIYNKLTSDVMDRAMEDFQSLDTRQKKTVAMLTQQPLVPETDAWLVSFTQEQYMKDRKMAESQGASIAGANSVKAGTATPGQQYGMGPRR